MTTAIGTYATTALVKARLGIPSDTADDTLLGTICDQVNAFIESPAGCGRVIAPISSATYLLDGDDTSTLYFPLGIRSISDLSLGDFTGDTRDTLASTDYFLRPFVYQRTPGWPAFYIQFTDRPSGIHNRFYAGHETISLTCTAGWAAIPDDLTMVALTTAVRVWHARQSGQADIVGNDLTGEPTISQFVAKEHWRTIQAYRVRQPQVFGTATVATLGNHRF